MTSQKWSRIWELPNQSPDKSQAKHAATSSKPILPKGNAPPKRGVGPGMLSPAGRNQFTRSRALRKSFFSSEVHTAATPSSISCRHEIDFSSIPHLASPWASARHLGMSKSQHAQTQTILLPSPADLAARKALAQRPPAPLERVLEQAASSRKFIAEWHAKGLPDLPLPPRLAKRNLDL